MVPGRLTYLNCGIESLAHRKSEASKQGTKGEGAGTDADSNYKSGSGDGYDVVTIWEVVEHVPNPSQFLSLVMGHVKPGGWIVLSTIARTWTSWMVTKLMAEDVLGIVPQGTHDWHRYINEYELREWFGKREGWESPRSMGCMYVPGFGWREVPGGENVGNYLFGIRKSPLS